MAYIEYYRYRSFIERWIELGYPVTDQGRPILAHLEELDEIEQNQLLGKSQPLSSTPSPQRATTRGINTQQDLEKTLSETLTPLVQRLEQLEKRVPNSSPQNGQHSPTPPSAQMITDRPQPIGFRVHEETPEISVHDFANDVYTVPHMYTRKGEQIIKPYGESLIQGRINQYSKLVEALESHPPYPTQAEERKRHERLREKKEILAYWEDKMIELHQKQIAANIREPNSLYKRTC